MESIKDEIVKRKKPDYPANEHPNIIVHHIVNTTQGIDYKYMFLSRENSRNDDATALALAIMRLSTEAIKYVVINHHLFSRSDFLFKTGNFNHSKCKEVLFWAFFEEEAREIINTKIP